MCQIRQITPQSSNYLLRKSVILHVRRSLELNLIFHAETIKQEAFS